MGLDLSSWVPLAASLWICFLGLFVIVAVRSVWLRIQAGRRGLCLKKNLFQSTGLWVLLVKSGFTAQNALLKLWTSFVEEVE